MTTTSAPSTLVDPEHWASAVCAQVDPEMFYPEKGEGTKDARDLCAACPLRQECLEFALANKEEYGVWGGLGAGERKALLRQRARSAWGSRALSAA